MKASLRTTPLGRPTATQPARPGSPALDTAASYAVRTPDERQITVGDGPPAFVIHVPTEAYWHTLWALDSYRAGMAFLNGDFDVEGDLVAAVDVWSRQPRTFNLPSLLLSLVPRLRPAALVPVTRHRPQEHRVPLRPVE